MGLGSCIVDMSLLRGASICKFLVKVEDVVSYFVFLFCCNGVGMTNKEGRRVSKQRTSGRRTF